jgi:hypothetical protein
MLRLGIFVNSFNLKAPTGKVVGVEHIKQLVDMSKDNLAKDSTHKQYLEDGTIEIIKADGRLGYAAKGMLVSEYSDEAALLTP